MDDRIREAIESGESDSEGLTNDVYFVGDSVVKVYRDYPATSFVMALADLLSLRPRYLDRLQRMENEVETKQRVRDAGLGAPEVRYVGDRAIEFEAVDGVSGYEWLDTCTGDEAREMGRLVADFLGVLHGDRVALKDLRVSNLVVGDEVYSIDHEYSSLDANRTELWFDYVTLFSSVRHTPAYEPFGRGFREVSRVPRSALFVAVFTSLFHAVFFERDLSRARKVLGSVGVDLRGFAGKVRRGMRPGKGD